MIAADRGQNQNAKNIRFLTSELIKNVLNDMVIIFSGAGTLSIRLLHGWLADHKSINKFMMYSTMCFLSGSGMIAYKFSDQYYQMLIASVAYVIGSGMKS